jgi:hypothetical protein
MSEIKAARNSFFGTVSETPTEANLATATVAILDQCQHAKKLMGIDPQRLCLLILAVDVWGMRKRI